MGVKGLVHNEQRYLALRRSNAGSPGLLRVTERADRFLSNDSSLSELQRLQSMDQGAIRVF